MTKLLSFEKGRETPPGSIFLNTDDYELNNFQRKLLSHGWTHVYFVTSPTFLFLGTVGTVRWSPIETTYFSQPKDNFIFLYKLTEDGKIRYGELTFAEVLRNLGNPL